jgi:hypothetical protein
MMQMKMLRTLHEAILGAGQTELPQEKHFHWSQAPPGRFHAENEK